MAGRKQELSPEGGGTPELIARFAEAPRVEGPSDDTSDGPSVRSPATLPVHPMAIRVFQ